MKSLEDILLRYTGLIWAMLGPLGSWGVFAIAGIDSAFFGIRLDPVVAVYVYQKPSRFLLYALMAAAGSAAGSMLLYIVGYKGGEALLAKRMTRTRFERIRKSLDEHEFWTVMFPSMIPPPFPFKLFVLAAAAFEMNFAHFLLAIFIGRFVRFLILAFLVLKFGPVIVSPATALVHQHLLAILTAVAAAVAAWLAIRYRRQPRTGWRKLALKFHLPPVPPHRQRSASELVTPAAVVTKTRTKQSTKRADQGPLAAEFRRSRALRIIAVIAILAVAGWIIAGLFAPGAALLANISPALPAESQAFLDQLAPLADSAVTRNNRIEPLRNGEQFYEAELAALRERSTTSTLKHTFFTRVK